MPATLAATLMVAFLVEVASKIATSPEPGTVRVDQLSPSFQLLVIPRPVQVTEAPCAGTVAKREPTTAIRMNRTRVNCGRRNLARQWLPFVDMGLIP